MTDEARIARLTELARKVWPNAESVHVSHDSARNAYVYATHGHPLLSIIDQDRALDALEAALLVLAGDDTRLELARLRERARDVIEGELDKRQPEWVEQLAEEWEAQAVRQRARGEESAADARECCAAELRERVKGAT